MPKFHYIYLAQNLLKTRFPTSFEQKKSRRPGLRLFCRKKVGRPGLRLVCDLVPDKSYDKIDLMEFGLNQVLFLGPHLLFLVGFLLPSVSQ